MKSYTEDQVREMLVEAWTRGRMPGGSAEACASRILGSSEGPSLPVTCAECEHGRQKMRDIICDKDGRCTPRGAPPPPWCPLRSTPEDRRGVP